MGGKKVSLAHAHFVGDNNVSIHRELTCIRRLFMIDRIMRGDYMPMEHGKWDDISEDAKNFVKSLLQVEPTRRPSAREALQSSWMKKMNDQDDETPRHVSADQKRLHARRSAVLLAMEKVSSAELTHLAQILKRYDPEETGSILFADLRRALLETGKWTSSDLEERLPNLDLVSLVRVDWLAAVPLTTARVLNHCASTEWGIRADRLRGLYHKSLGETRTSGDR